MLEKEIKKVLITEAEIQEKTKALGQQLTKEYAGKTPILIGILKGSIPFMAELIKHIDTHIETEYMIVSSYHGGTESSGRVKIIKDIDIDIKDRDIIFIEDIIDTGRTLKEIIAIFANRQAKSIKIATLVDKPEARIVDMEADYTCFELPNEFLVGFGLDYNEKYRNLPYIGVLKEEMYSN